MHESFLTHAKNRYLWVAVALLALTIFFYAWHDPIGRANGGSWYGYTVGTIGAVLIVWLMLFGVRKRKYGNRLGTLRGWLSAHVYLGTTLLVIVLLHSGFQFGWNLHTLAFVLMTIVIFSGFFGVYAYLRYPNLMTRNRENATRQAMLDEIAEIDGNALALADGIDPKLHAIVLRSITRTKLGGGVWNLLTARDGSDLALSQARDMLEQRGKPDAKAPKTEEMPTMFAMVDFLSNRADDKQAEALRKLIDLLSRKKGLATRVARDIQFQSLMEIWLYFHVPLSFALLAALLGHIVAVFFYW